MLIVFDELLVREQFSSKTSSEFRICIHCTSHLITGSLLKVFCWMDWPFLGNWLGTLLQFLKICALRGYKHASLFFQGDIHGLEQNDECESSKKHVENCCWCCRDSCQNQVLQKKPNFHVWIDFLQKWTKKSTPMFTKKRKPPTEDFPSASENVFSRNCVKKIRSFFKSYPSQRTKFRVPGNGCFQNIGK